ncbi:MAG: cupredoxin domain-containing protein [Alphaproteobacteria bacterium]|nr:cupredoxin domain-containing protein [Alphaproteobacteria bacterium]
MPKRRAVIAGIGAVVASMLANGSANRARALGPTRHRVIITDFEFVPSVLTVHPGDFVTWANLDIAPHTATARDKTWDTKRLNAKREETIQVREGMATDYFCRFHPMMKGKLRIVEG